jgi:hypothetical protein
MNALNQRQRRLGLHGSGCEGSKKLVTATDHVAGNAADKTCRRFTRTSKSVPHAPFAAFSLNNHTPDPFPGYEHATLA